MSMSKALSQDVYSSPLRRVSLTDVEKELANLWDGLSRETNGGQTLTRACMSTLVIYCDTRIEANTILDELPEIVNAHPARVLLLVGESEENEDLTAYISVHYCQVSEGWQLCAEQVTVYCRASAVRRLPSIPRFLCIGNLPITLWWVSSQPPPLAGELFYNQAANANQVIFDSIGWREPAKGVQAVAHWIAGNHEHIIYSLAWRRLKMWRKLISDVLDPAVTPNALDTVNRLEIEHGPHALPVAWLLVGWLAVRLNWRPVSGKVVSPSATNWRFEGGGKRIDVLVKRLDEGDARLYQMLWRWGGKHSDALLFSQLSERTLGVRKASSQVTETVIAMPDIGHAQLVARQMAHRFHDELFEQVQDVSSQMASVLS